MFFRSTSKLPPVRSESSPTEWIADVELGYEKLECRRVLSATFSFAAGQLLLDGFDPGQDVSFSQDDAVINGSMTDAYLFELSTGSWTGSDLDPNVEVESVNGGRDNLLEIATDFFGGAANASLRLDGATGTPLNIDLQQMSPVFSVGDFSISQISSVDSSFDLNIDGHLTLEQIEVVDSNPNDTVTLPVDLNVRSTGPLDVTGSLINQMANDNAGIRLTTTDAGSDITLAGTVESLEGSVEIRAGGNLLGSDVGTGHLISADGGTVRIDAGGDVGVVASEPDIFKSSKSDFGLIRLSTPAVTISAAGAVGVEEVSTTSSDFTINANSAYLFSAGEMVYQNGVSTLDDLILVSDRSVILPDSITVIGDLRIVGLDEVSAVDGSIDIVANRMLFRSGSAATLNTVVNAMDLTTQGELVVDSSVSLDLRDLDGDSVAVHNRSIIGDISILASNALTVSDAIIAGPLDPLDSQGTIRLNSGRIQIDAIVATDTGDILIESTAETSFASTGMLTTVAGDIELTASAIEMEDGSKLVAGRDDAVMIDPANPTVELAANSIGGTVFLSSNGNIELGSVQTNNATANAVSIVTRFGTVLDGGDLDRDVIAEQTTSVVNVESAFGIGAGNALETSIAQLAGFSQSTGDIAIEELNSIRLLNLNTANGFISVQSTGNIEAIDVQTREADAVEDDLDSILLTSTSGSIVTDQLVSADDVRLDAGDSIVDLPGGRLIAEGNAVFVAANQIEFANEPGRFLFVDGTARFEGTNIRIGQDDRPAGDSAARNVELGAITIRAAEATLTEDDATSFVDITTIDDRLSVSSAVSIDNLPNASILVDEGHAQLNATQLINLGSQENDTVRLASVGTVSANVNLTLDSGVTINGSSPIVDPSRFGSDASFGTQVDQTLYVTSTAQIVQTEGNLHARLLGLRAAEYVHLSSVSDVNESIAINANGSAMLADPTMQSQLQSLAQIENSEVDASNPLSISFRHQGIAKIGSVESPVSTESIAGLQSNDHSIFVSAIAGIQIHEDIVARSSANEPQITLYVEEARALDPRIEFVSSEARVEGPQNLGIVNAPQTTATFFDTEGNVFRGTTEILVLNPDGSANQDIVLFYGHSGETGYRVGVIWDVDNQPGNPVEALNTYVANLGDPSEAFDDLVYRENPTTLLLIGGNEGGAAETITKVERFSKDAIIAHQDQPKVFSQVTVRNDQNINLFAGELAEADNSLNEFQQRLRADLDAPKKFAIQPPPISTLNPIPIREPIDVAIVAAAPDEVATTVFVREVQMFETGELKWVRVQIPLRDLEEFGDEVRLKDPTKIYPDASNAEEVPVGGSIGENEFEKIIRQIESDRNAEPGYWYKVFKDYKNRDDELFFYHLKTGDVPQPDFGPDSDFKDDAPDQNGANVPQQDAPEFAPEEAAPPEARAPGENLPQEDHFYLDDIRELPDPESASFETAPTQAPPLLDEFSTKSHPAGLSGISLIMAGMLLDRREGKIIQNQDPEGTTEHLDHPRRPGFLQLDRWKRKFRRLID